MSRQLNEASFTHCIHCEFCQIRSLHINGVQINNFNPNFFHDVLSCCFIIPYTKETSNEVAYRAPASPISSMLK